MPKAVLMVFNMDRASTLLGFQMIKECNVYNFEGFNFQNMEVMCKFGKCKAVDDATIQLELLA